MTATMATTTEDHAATGKPANSLPVEDFRVVMAAKVRRVSTLVRN